MPKFQSLSMNQQSQAYGDYRATANDPYLSYSGFVSDIADWIAWDTQTGKPLETYPNRKFFGETIPSNEPAIAPLEEPAAIEYAKVKRALDQISAAVNRHGLVLVVDPHGNYDVERHES